MAADIGSDTAAPRSAPDDARCPRCCSAFHCGLHDATPCACTTLRLSAATLAELRARYNGCLCMRCLHALSHDASAPARTAAGDTIDAERLDELMRQMSRPRDGQAP